MGAPVRERWSQGSGHLTPIRFAAPFSREFETELRCLQYAIDVRLFAHKGLSKYYTSNTPSTIRPDVDQMPESTQNICILAPEFPTRRIAACEISALASPAANCFCRQRAGVRMSLLSKTADAPDSGLGFAPCGANRLCLFG